LTGSELLLGIVGFCSQIPMLVLSPFAGVLVDRWDRHRILVIPQILSALQSAALAVLALMNVITVAEVIVLQLVQGVINSFDTPARQAFVVEMVEDRADLPNAIALNSSMINASRIIGPSIGGVLIATLGEGWCFGADAISYIAVIASLLAMRVAAVPPRANPRRLTVEMREGWQYVRGSAPIRAVLLLLATISLVGMPYTVLMPIFAGPILHGGANTLGFLMAASGLGALAGAITLAMRRSVLGLGRVIAWSSGLFGAALIGFSFSRYLPLSLLFVAIAGFGMMRHMASCNTIVQTIVAEDMRGRVMAYYSLAFQGVAPFGSLAAGSIAAKAGAPWTLVSGGVLCLAGAAVFARKLPDLRQKMRPIYTELGILPPISPSPETAS
jgi:MFS family permease